MKKEQSIINKEDFFAGKLTDDQEKQLKNNDDNSFFEVLIEEKEIKMELSFDDFMTKVEDNQPKEIEKSRVKKYLLWQVSGFAASVLIVVGMFFFLNKNKEVENLPTIVKTNQSKEIVENPTESIKIKENITSDKFEIKEEVVKIKQITKEIKIVKEKSITQPIDQEVTKTESAEEYSSDFVVVNGQPVENIEEAKALAYNTMKIFSKNVNQGAKAIGQLKSLSIEL